MDDNTDQNLNTFADKIADTVESLAEKTVRLYAVGSNPSTLSSDLRAIQELASRMDKDKDHHPSRFQKNSVSL